MPSSVIQAMRYDPSSKTLEIVYRGNRGRYRYSNIPAEEWTAFTGSPSKGTYLNEVFKAKNYRYEKVQPERRTSPLSEGILRWPDARHRSVSADAAPQKELLAYADPD